MLRRSLSAWLVFAVGASLLADEKPTVKPLPNAHSHNDYHRRRPLFDALDHGFCSVEADVFLVDGELLVGHWWLELRTGRTLQKLYLDPLRERAKLNGGRIYPGGPTVTLLIDIKKDGKKVYAELQKALASYKDILSSVEDGKYHERAVQVVLSGARPFRMIADDKIRYAGIDGRTSDLGSKAPSHLIPMISDSWSSQFRWRGKGPMPEAERAKLRSIVRRAHSAGRRVRFWATPESPAVWRELRAAGVDHINTDKLGELAKFLIR